MTRNRSWLALGTLLVTLAGGALWAADQEKKANKAPAPSCCAEKAACCADKCCAKEQGCCEAKCCAEEKAKGCCADGKCCGCCNKAPQMASFPVPPGSAIQMMIAPPGAFGDEACYTERVCPSPACQPTPPVSFGPPLQTVCQPPMPSPVAPITQYVLDPRVVPPPPVPPVSYAAWVSRPTPWRVSVVQEGGKSCLGMQVGVSKDTSATCESLMLKNGDLKLTIVGKQVAVSGKQVQATADSVCWSAENGDILLDGSVKLSYHGDGHTAEITAAQVIVGVPDGRIEVMGAGSIAPKATSPVNTSPVRCPARPACPAPTTQGEQMFNFFTGFFRW